MMMEKGALPCRTEGRKRATCCTTPAREQRQQGERDQAMMQALCKRRWPAKLHRPPGGDAARRKHRSTHDEALDHLTPRHVSNHAPTVPLHATSMENPKLPAGAAAGVLLVRPAPWTVCIPGVPSVMGCCPWPLPLLPRPPSLTPPSSSAPPPPPPPPLSLLLLPPPSPLSPLLPSPSPPTRVPGLGRMTNSMAPSAKAGTPAGIFLRSTR